MTQILVLAAGQGTRLRPYTNTTPKALVPLNGIPFFDYLQHSFQVCNLNDIAVVTGYCQESFVPRLVDQFHNPDFASSNMVYSMFAAKSLFNGEQDIIVSYSDIIYQPDVLQSVLTTSGDVVVCADTQWESLWRLRMENPLDDAESFVFDEQHNIQELGKKVTDYRKVMAQYIGLIKFDAAVTKEIASFYEQLAEKMTPEQHRNIYFTDFIQLLIDSGRYKVKASFIERGWVEVDTTDDLACYEALIAEKAFEKLGLSESFISSVTDSHQVQRQE